MTAAERRCILDEAAFRAACNRSRVALGRILRHARKVLGRRSARAMRADFAAGLRRGTAAPDCGPGTLERN